MSDWQRQLTEHDRIRQHTPQHVLAQIDDAMRVRVRQYRHAPRARITSRLAELDEEWDIERVLITNAASFASIGIVTGLAWKRSALAFPLAVGLFLLQHGIQGWCPPLAIFRRRGIRTRREIDLERYALKAIRGDFDPGLGREEANAILAHAARP